MSCGGRVVGTVWPMAPIEVTVMFDWPDAQAWACAVVEATGSLSEVYRQIGIELNVDAPYTSGLEALSVVSGMGGAKSNSAPVPPAVGMFDNTKLVPVVWERTVVPGKMLAP